MGLTLRLTKVYSSEVTLNDEEAAEYLEAKEKGDEDYFLDPYLSDLDEVETMVEEF